MCFTLSMNYSTNLYHGCKLNFNKKSRSGDLTQWSIPCVACTSPMCNRRGVLLKGPSVYRSTKTFIAKACDEFDIIK